MECKCTPRGLIFKSPNQVKLSYDSNKTALTPGTLIIEQGGPDPCPKMGCNDATKAKSTYKARNSKKIPLLIRTINFARPQITGDFL